MLCTFAIPTLHPGVKMVKETYLSRFKVADIYLETKKDDLLTLLSLSTAIVAFNMFS